MTITLQPINVDKDPQLCLFFHKLAYISSYGDDKRFYEDFQKNADKEKTDIETFYINWVHKLQQFSPDSCMHLWLDNRVIGQIIMGILQREKDYGHIFLFSLLPAYQNKELGALLQNYAETFFLNKGLKKLSLLTTPQNSQALTFYKKHGWVNKGVAPKNPRCVFFTKEILDI